MGGSAEKWRPRAKIRPVGSASGFGLTALAVTLLLHNYYGRKHNLEIFSLTCLIGVVSALGPVITGSIRDVTGGFGLSFQVFCGVILIILIAVVFMRPPLRQIANLGPVRAHLDSQLAEDPA